MFSRQNQLTNKKIAPIAASAFVALVVVGGLSLVPAANAAVSFNPQTGQGFVGKGDVQTALGWNNAQLQSGAASLQFTATSTVVTEREWTCTNSNNQNEQVRERTTTTTISGVVSQVARERNQITGFNLIGYGSTSESSTSDGPPLNSCPSGPWSLTQAAGDPVVVSQSGELKVNSVTIATF